MSEELKVKALHMGPAECAVDLGDGSERGEYVDQDYILQISGRDVPVLCMQIRLYSSHGIFHTMIISPIRVV